MFTLIKMWEKLNSAEWWESTPTKYDPETGYALSASQKLVDGKVVNSPNFNENSWLLRTSKK